MDEASPFGRIGVKVFVDSGDPSEIRDYLSNAWIAGATTNPSLMTARGHSDAISFTKEVSPSLAERSFSIVPMAMDSADFLGQAATLSTIGENIFVKVPIIDQSHNVNSKMVDRLIGLGVGIHINCIHTLQQARTAAGMLRGANRGLMSIFAGRLSDSGQSPTKLVSEAVRFTADLSDVVTVWAGARELLNVRQAEQVGVDAITVAPTILQRASEWGTDPETLASNAAHQLRGWEY